MLFNFSFCHYFSLLLKRLNFIHFSRFHRWILIHLIVLNVLFFYILLLLFLFFGFCFIIIMAAFIFLILPHFFISARNTFNFLFLSKLRCDWFCPFWKFRKVNNLDILILLNSLGWFCLSVWRRFTFFVLWVIFIIVIFFISGYFRTTALYHLQATLTSKLLVGKQ